MAGKHGIMNLRNLNSALFAAMRAEAAQPRRNAPLRVAVASASASAARQRTPTAPAARRSPAWRGKIRTYFAKGRARKAAGTRAKDNLAKARPALRAAVRESRRSMNINKLIAQADAAERAFNVETDNSVERRIRRAEFYRTRDAVLEELGRRAGERNSRVGQILKNINKRKHAIVANINNTNKTNRYITWRQYVARNQGGSRPHNFPVYKGSPPRPPPPPPSGRRTPEWARGIGASNIANYLVRRGLKV
jgi:hypothetical protein